MIEFEYTTNTTEATVPGFKDLVVTEPSADAAVEGAHAIAVLTEWDEFKHYDYAQIYEKMAKPVRFFPARACSGWLRVIFGC